jgi:hypothetical protein
MINANYLNKIQEQREQEKNKIYDKIYELIEKKIILASSCNYYYIIYEVPEFYIGLPLYSLNKCCEYIKNKLILNSFCYDFYEPNIILISWEQNNKTL